MPTQLTMRPRYQRRAQDFEDLDDEDDGQAPLGREEDDDELFVLEHNNEFEGCDSINHPDCIDPLKASALQGNRRLWDLWDIR